jgi:hypothetical protein
MPAEGGALRLSHPARHLVGRVKARPYDQYFLRWLARLKPSARTRYPAVTHCRDENTHSHTETLRYSRGSGYPQTVCAELMTDGVITI